MKRKTYEYTLCFIFVLVGLNILKIYEKTSRLDKLFEKRKKILKRSCLVKHRISQMKKSREITFSDLLAFHRKVHTIDEELKIDDEKCGPRFPGGNRGVYDIPGKKILACLVPKCASTTFTRALAPLAMRNGTAADFHAPLVYEQLHEFAATTINYLDEDPKYAHYLSFNVVRNPFERLYAAWSDKFRTGEVIEDLKVQKIFSIFLIFHHFFKNKHGFREIDVEERVQKYLNVFWPILQYLQISQVEDKTMNTTFENFAKYLSIEEMDDSYRNWHWRSFWYFCSPCMFNYNAILHLEDVEDELKHLMSISKQNQKFSLPSDYQSASKSNYKTVFASLPREIFEQLYRAYYEDFITFGFSAEDVEDLHKKTRSSPESLILPFQAVAEAEKLSKATKADAPVEQWQICNEHRKEEDILKWTPSKGDAYKKESIRYPGNYPIKPWDGSIETKKKTNVENSP